MENGLSIFRGMVIQIRKSRFLVYLKGAVMICWNPNGLGSVKLLSTEAECVSVFEICRLLLFMERFSESLVIKIKITKVKTNG